MDNSTHQTELMMRYLDGEMPEGERRDFEKMLAGNPGLKEEFENLRLAKSALLSYGLKEKVAAIHQDMMKELAPVSPVKNTSKVRRIIRYSVAVAASAALIFFAYQVFEFYSLSSSKLYAENYISYELTNTRGSDTIQDSPLEKAFREKRYDEVIRLNAVSVLSSRDIFLTGLAYLETGDAGKAVSSFQVVLADQHGNASSLKTEAEYYLAMAYLKNRDYDQAIELMTKIQETPSHPYYKSFSKKYIGKVKKLKWR